MSRRRPVKTRIKSFERCSIYALKCCKIVGYERSELGLLFQNWSLSSFGTTPVHNEKLERLFPNKHKTFVQCRSNVCGVGPALYKCFLCLLGWTSLLLALEHSCSHLLDKNGTAMATWPTRTITWLKSRSTALSPPWWYKNYFPFRTKTKATFSRPTIGPYSTMCFQRYCWL